MMEIFCETDNVHNTTPSGTVIGINFGSKMVDKNEDLIENSFLKMASVACGILIVPIAMVGIIGNLLTIHILKRKMGRRSINILLIGLARCDCLLLVFGTPIFSLVSLYVVNESLEKILNHLILYVYPLAMMAQSASVWCTVVITLERFVAIMYPLRARVLCKVKNVRVALSAVIIIAVLYNVCRFWEYDLENNKLCNVLKNSRLYLRLYAHWLYFFIIFLIPFSLLIVFNGLIINEINSSRLHRAELTRHQTQEHKIALMMAIVILVFFICNALALVLNAIEATEYEKCIVINDCERDNQHSDKSITVAVTTTEVEITNIYCVSTTDAFFFLVDFNNLLIEINSSVNFIIYYAFSQRFRKHFRQLWPLVRKYRRRNRHDNNDHLNHLNFDDD